MIYLMAKDKQSFSTNKSNNHITVVLILLLLAILAGGVYFSLPIIKSTELYKNYQSNKEVTFVSKRANFSFKHPNWWPVSVVDFEAKDGMYKYLYAEDGVIEYIDFEEEFHSQAGWPTLGFIMVQKTKYKNLKEYVDKLSQEQVVYEYGRKVTIKPPKIEYLKIGGEDAINITDINNFATFSRNTVDYQLIINGWLYRFVTVDSSRFEENKERNSKTFQQIISSVKFF